VTEPGKHTAALGEALVKLGGKKLAQPVIESALARVKFTDKPLEETFKTMATWASDLDFERGPSQLSQLFDLKISTELGSQNGPEQGRSRTR
jgi:hypothetical protein